MVGTSMSMKLYTQMILSTKLHLNSFQFNHILQASLNDVGRWVCYWEYWCKFCIGTGEEQHDYIESHGMSLLWSQGQEKQRYVEGKLLAAVGKDSSNKGNLKNQGKCKEESHRGDINLLVLFMSIVALQMSFVT